VFNSMPYGIPSTADDINLVASVNSVYRSAVEVGLLIHSFIDNLYRQFFISSIHILLDLPCVCFVCAFRLPSLLTFVKCNLLNKIRC